MTSKASWSKHDGKDTQADVTNTENILTRISSNQSVLELLTYDENGMVLRSTMDTAKAQIYRNSITSLNYIAKKTVKNMDPRDDLKFIRMRTQSTEIIIAPDDGATLMVIQQVEPYEPPYRPPKEQPEVTTLRR